MAVVNSFDFAGPGASVESRWNEATLRCRHVKRTNWTATTAPQADSFEGWDFVASDVGGGRTDSFLWQRKDYNDYMYILSGNEVGETYFGVAVASDDPDLADKMFGICKELFPEAAPKDTDVTVNFWYMTPNGPAATNRNLDAPKWDEIRDNYPSLLRQSLTSLIHDWKPGVGGKLLLWQGPAGVGKTYAIRALAREWASWCKVSYITDIEEFFSRSAYMLNVLLREDGPKFKPTGEMFFDRDKWHLVILEDAGELIAKDAKLKTGPALSKLLNIADGMIGQGLRVLLLITTNEELGALNDAVSRPGRCASKLSFGELGATERVEWAAKRGIENLEGARTLAELYALERGQKVEVPRKVGFAV